MAPLDISLIIHNATADQKRPVPESEKSNSTLPLATTKTVHFSTEILPDNRFDEKPLVMTPKEFNDCFFGKEELQEIKRSAKRVAKSLGPFLDQLQQGGGSGWKLFRRGGDKKSENHDKSIQHLRGLEIVAGDSRLSVRGHVVDAVSAVLRQQAAGKNNLAIAKAYQKRCNKCVEEALERARVDEISR